MQTGGNIGYVNYKLSRITMPDNLGRDLVVYGTYTGIFYKLLLSMTRHIWQKMILINPDSGRVKTYPFLLMIPHHFIYSLWRYSKRALWVDLFNAILANIRPCESKGTNRIIFFFRKPILYVIEKYYFLRIRYLLSSFPDPLLQKNELDNSRMCFFIGSLEPGGAERQLVNTILGVQKNCNKQIHVICEYLTDEIHRFHLDTLQNNGVIVEPLSKYGTTQMQAVIHPKVSKSISRLAFCTSILSYINALVTIKPAIVHAWLDMTNIKSGIAAVLTGIPTIILSQRSVAPYNFELFLPYMRGGYLNLAIHPTVHFLNNSYAGAADYANWIGIQNNAITVIHNGFRKTGSEIPETVQTAFKSQLDIPEDAMIVGTVIRFTEEKQPLLWMETANLLQKEHSNLYFIIAGDGPLLDNAKAYADDHQFLHKVRFLGAIDHPLLTMSVMDVFLLTSRMEGLPNVLLEAQSVGRPVVTTDVGGAAETIIDNVTGYSVKSYNARCLSRRVSEILSDRKWREAAKVKAPEFIQATFDTEKMVCRTLEIYGLR